MLETKKTPLTPSCVLEAGFVSLEVVCFEAADEENILEPSKATT